jgi:hypothetical protein
MSLAMTAATFDEDDNAISNNNLIYKKKHQGHSTQNKTQKHNRRIENFIDNEKVNSVLASIHKGYGDEDDDDTFRPSMVTQKQQNQQETQQAKQKQQTQQIRQTVNFKEGMMNNNDGDGSVPLPLEQNGLDLQTLDNNYMNDKQVENYYKQLMPNYRELNNIKRFNNHNNTTTYYNHNNNNNANNNTNNNPVIDKLNYIINLLEEQQDQRTNNVTEEIILYSFLGVFIIFVVDGFSKVGKYVR